MTRFWQISVAPIALLAGTTANAATLDIINSTAPGVFEYGLGLGEANALSFAWDGTPDPLRFYVTNNTGSAFTDIHVKAGARQSTLRITASNNIFNDSPSCRNCFEQGTNSGGGKGGIVSGNQYRFSLRDFANPVPPLRSYNILIWGTRDPLPEPASWAMLIVGFGLCGATLRRTRMTISTSPG